MDESSGFEPDPQDARTSARRRGRRTTSLHGAPDDASIVTFLISPAASSSCCSRGSLSAARVLGPTIPRERVLPRRDAGDLERTVCIADCAQRVVPPSRVTTNPRGDSPGRVITTPRTIAPAANTTSPN